MRLIATLLGFLLALSSFDRAFATETETESAKVAAPPSPADPLKAQVFQTLATHCAACHQTKLLDGPAPAGQFGNVLALDELVREPRLVLAGNPDGSRLFSYLLDGRHHASPDAATPARPSAAEIAAAHQWIEQLPAPGVCPGHSLVAHRGLEAAIRAWLAVFSDETARDTRFVTLAHIANECASAQELSAHRAAVGKILNSLSWRKSPVRARTIDGSGHVLAVRLSELGWSAELWDTLAGAQPDGAGFRASLRLAEIVGAERPAVRADWLAHAAMRPPLYDTLLDMPDRLRGLERRLGIDPESGAAPPPAVERRETAAGSMWVAREGPSEPTRVLFSLPNGFPAFAAFGPDGRRLEAATAPPGAGAMDDLSLAWIGKSCLGCPAGDAPVANALALFRIADNLRYRSALIRAGVDPDATMHGLEIVAALARRWTGDANADRIAAELGETPQSLARRLADLPARDWRLATRAMQALISRDEANALMARLENPQRAPAEPSPRQGEEAHGGVRLTLSSDKPAYRLGDRPAFEIGTNTPCHLTLVSVNPRGFATVLLPNDFERETLIAPGPPTRMPDLAAPYDLRFSEKGRETIIAICESRPDFGARIRHRFLSQQFTSLGKWRDFIAGTSAAPARKNGHGAARAAIVLEVSD